ncbi:MAG: glycosyltransferase [Candidatus Nealsonbacteria bacterium]|nr:glycosyltransferase [Candidatus Nealsonbacteria bacterium]
MRILHVIPSLRRSGTEKQMALLAGSLAGDLADEFDVHVCAIGRGGPVADDLAAAGVPVTVLAARWRFDPQAIWRLRRLVAELRADVIHSWQFSANVSSHAVARLCGVRCHVAHCGGVDPSASWFKMAARRHVARRCAQVVVGNSAVRDGCVRGGLPAEKIRVIANGVPSADPPGTTRSQLLAELKLPESSRLVGLLGPLRLRKQIKDAIWAADLLKVIRDDVHLLIAGDGPHGNRLRTFRDQVGIRDKVHFLGHCNDVSQLLPHLDVFWSTEVRQGPSNAIMEAMAAGVPVVAANVPGVAGLVTADKTGYLIPAGDRAALARHTQRLLNDAELATRLGTAGRERMQREFGVEAMVGRYAELYRELLG